MNNYSYKYGQFIIGCFSLCNIGCDAIYRVQQPVLIQITYPHDGQVASGVTVDFALACTGERWKHERLTNEECIARFGGRAQRTDQNGYATLPIDSYLVYGGFIPGLIPGPNLKADRVKGRIYLLRMDNGNEVEYLESKILLNSRIVGKHYEVIILDIRPPTRLPLSVGASKRKY